MFIIFIQLLSVCQYSILYLQNIKAATTLQIEVLQRLSTANNILLFY